MYDHEKTWTLGTQKDTTRHENNSVLVLPVVSLFCYHGFRRWPASRHLLSFRYFVIYLEDGNSHCPAALQGLITKKSGVRLNPSTLPPASDANLMLLEFRGVKMCSH